MGAGNRTSSRKPPARRGARWAVLGGLSALALVASTSCSGGGEGSGPPRPDGGSVEEGLCKEACAVAVVPGCSPDSKCFCASETAPQAACHAEAEAKWECVRSGASFKCVDQDVKLDKGCEAEQLAYAQCLLCVPDSKDGPCPACEIDNCCEEYGALIGVPGFDDIKDNCIAACTDAACVEACYRSDPAVEAAYDKALGCRASNCGSECS